MATVERFEDLIIWQLARKFSRDIFELATKEIFKNEFGLINQIRDSSGSVMDNIAEGFDRQSRLEFRQFLSVAKGSLGESKSQIYKAFDRGYIDESIFNKFVFEIETLSTKINNTIEFLNLTPFISVEFKYSIVLLIFVDKVSISKTNLLNIDSSI